MFVAPACDDGHFLTWCIGSIHFKKGRLWP
uniref:Uncharacterized protein n=1 Tax=Anguilla anguilla TaxID=7936 RepID=A0A0E9PFS9_ANGAN